MDEQSQSAWLPLTPRGVAAFARARLGRLWLVQFLVALIAAAVMAWAVHRAWFPVVREAIQQMPARGEIRLGRLQWPEEPPRLLAEGHWLAFSVDMKHSGAIRSPAHIQVELNQDGFAIYSLLGYTEGNYPGGWIFPFNRTQLEPKWDAWNPVLLAGVVAAVLIGLMVSWAVLATIYFLPVWLVGFFLNRDLDFRASWKLAGAALMPGALGLTAAILIYGLGLMDLVRLVAALVTHFVIGWIHLLIAPFFLPQKPAAKTDGKNPFAK